MFQNMNVAKSALFALLTIYPKIHVSPQSSLNPPFWQITRNSPTIFQFAPWKMTCPKSTANAAKSAPFTTIGKNYTKSM